MTMGYIYIVRIVIVVCLACAGQALDNGLGLTPQMAWNSWNTFACSINEQVIRATADAVIVNGLNKFGYEYINVDDCWAGSRNASGYVEADPVSFPSGMKALADYVHSLGLKFGLYSDAGTKTCAGRPGSLGYETQDAEQYSIWGVDYLKYDNCDHPANISDIVRTQAMRDALNKTGRPIFYSMCEGYIGIAYHTYNQFGPVTGNSWRTTTDIGAYFESWVNNIDQSDAVADVAAPGGWNDPDMLEVGNGKLTVDQNIAHFSLWALAKAPLILGNDLRQLAPEILSIVTNPEVIAINQDSLGKQGTRLSYSMAAFSTIFGNVLYSEACVGTPAQQFSYVDNLIISKLTNLCVGQYCPVGDCAGYGASLGSTLYLQECQKLCGGKFQNFTINSTSSTFYPNWGNPVCVEGTRLKNRNQSDIRFAECVSGSPQQTWIFKNGEIQNKNGDCLTVSRGDEAWGGPLADGTYAVVLFNRASINQTVTVWWSGAASVRDLWAHENLGLFASSYSTLVNAQGAVALKVSPF